MNLHLFKYAETWTGEVDFIDIFQSMMSRTFQYLKIKDNRHHVTPFSK